MDQGWRNVVMAKTKGDSESRTSTVGGVLGTSLGLILVTAPLAVAVLRLQRRRPNQLPDRIEASTDREDKNLHFPRGGEVRSARQAPEFVMRQHDTEHKSQATRDKARLVIETFGLLALVVAGITAYCTVLSMDEQTRILSTQLRVADQAWVIPDRAVLMEPITAINAVTARYGLKNVGRRPAFEVRSSSFFDLMDSRIVPAPGPVKDPDGQPGSTTVIGPGDTVPMAQIWINGDRSRRLTEKELADLDAGRQRLYMGVVVTYRDPIQTPTEPKFATFFCYMYDPTIPGMVQCRDGNFIGTETELNQLARKGLKLYWLSTTGLQETTLK